MLTGTPRISLALLAPLFVLVACSGGDAPHPTSPAITGSIAITVSGIPAGSAAAITVTGPNAYGHTVSASTTLDGLALGTYTITAANTIAGTTTYVPAPASQSVTLSNSSSAGTAAVSYTASARGVVDLSIAALYITQGAQTRSGAVPLVAGRAGLLRVFVVADRPNAVRPTVRARFFAADSLVSTVTIAAPAQSVPTAVDESSLTTSWNYLVPPSLLRPGLSVIADVDPENEIDEGDEGDNVFPSSESGLALSVNIVPTFSMELVPVLDTAGTPRVGNISTANEAAFLAATMNVHPLAQYDAEVHATYTADAAALVSTNGNGAWGDILSQMLALRTMEGSGRQYYGVVKAPYRSGIAGIGYVGLPAAVGWDDAGSAPWIAAHELGHNWGRSHSPCGGASNPDPSYPYANGRTGTTGYDIAFGVLHAPSEFDVMSYCHPEWISDYTYAGVLAYRQASAAIAERANASPRQPCLVVWGRIVSGRVLLEPAVEMVTRPQLPEGRGAYTLRGTGARGAELFALSFDAGLVADLPREERHFAFAIPLSRVRGTLAALELRGPAGSAHLASRTMTSAAPGNGAPSNASATRLTSARVITDRVAAGRLRVTWDATRYPLAVIRDAHTGQILSIAHGGSARVWTSANALEAVLSDGVRSVEVRVSAGG